MEQIITNVFEPQLKVSSKESMQSYTSMLANLSYKDMCIEFSNVMSAKHNQMAGQTSISQFEEKQNLVYDLTSRATVICLIGFGQDTISKFCGNDFTPLNELINNLDSQVVKLDLEPEAHGDALIRKLTDVL